MPELPRKPKSQFEISTQGSNIQGDDLGRELKHDRSGDVRRDTDNVRDYKVTLKDIDTALLYYLDNIVLPSITENGQTFKVPVIYGSPERWKSTQEDGYYKDRTGKIMIPLVMFRRTGMTKNRNLVNKVDANSPHVYQTITKQWSRKNAYDHFNLVNGISPVTENYNIVVPDYVDITYECIVWTDFVEQMNTIIEAINYSEGSYWGEPERFKFRVRIDDYSNTTDLVNDEDRTIKTAFTINLAGYIIPDSINAQLANRNKKAFGSSKIRFDQETQIPPPHTPPNE